MKPFLSWPIRRHLLFLVFLATLPAFGIIVSSGLEMRRLTVEGAERDLTHLLVRLASTQEHLADQARELFLALSDLPAVRRRDAAACNTLFTSILPRTPQYANLMAMDPAGEVFASGVPFTPTNAVDRKYFREAVAMRDFSAGEYAVSRTTNKSSLHFAHPVFDEKGRLLAMIVAAFDLRRFEAVYAREGMPMGSMLLITDHAGVVLHDSRDPSRSGRVTQEESILSALRGSGGSGIFRARPADGIRRLFAFRQVRLTPERPPYLLVAVGIPESYIYATHNRILARNLLFLGAAALFAAAAAWGLGNVAIVNRAKSLVSASQRLGKGDLSARTGLPVTGGELGHLAEAFDEMARSIETRETDRRKAEEALRVSEERYRLVVENASDAIFIAQDGRIKFPNPRLMALTGYSAEEVASEPFFLDYVLPEDRESVVERHMRRLRGEDVPNRYTLRVLPKSGEPLWMENIAILIPWEGRPATLNFLRDFSRQKELEAQLLHAQKMEAVGTLAGGVAHDFNNLLQAIAGFASLALRDLPEGDTRRPFVQNIEKAAARAKELVRRLLTFSRRDRTRQRPLDLNREVAHTVEFLERTIPKMIRIETRLSPDLRPVVGDATQIEQVVMNLGTNARDAMPEGGLLLIETENRTVAAGETAEAAPGEYVILRVKDTGIGIDPAAAAKIYDPFYTTKEVGAGTGLGLSTVYGTVRSHGGRIQCRSEPGRGTCFEIFLPACDGPVSPPEEDAAPEPASGAGAILLVDDEEMVRDLGKTILEADGYSVRAAGSGEEALDLFRSNPDGFDLVILDLGMPGMGGRKCLAEIKMFNPAAKILVVSGYSEEQQASGILEAGASAFVAKPYLPRELGRTVRRILSGSP